MIDLVVKIAREKLGCDFNYNEACKFLKECFSDLDNQSIDDILFGRKTAIATDSGGELIDVPDNSVLNYIELYTLKLNDIEKYLLNSFEIEHLKRDLNHCFIDFEDILNYYENREDPFINSNEIYAWRSAISTYTDNYNTLKCMIDSLRHFNEPELIDTAIELYSKVERGLLQLKSPIEKLDNVSNDLTEYVSNELELNKIDSIQPSENYHDAGYISLNGNYYGLDGKVANFLHLRIADLLVKQEKIPYYPNQSDYAIDKAGYIKQHDNKITAYRVFDQKFLTQKQLNTAIKIISQKWKEIIFDFGDGDWTVSIDKVSQLNSDELEFQYKNIWH